MTVIVDEDHIYAYVILTFVNRRLMFDLLQLKVLAEDGGSPPRSATATVSITVERNLAAPEFTPQRYETEILEVRMRKKYFTCYRIRIDLKLIPCVCV